MSKDILEIYKVTPYEELEPRSSDPTQAVFKFNSPTHFRSWVKALDRNFPRGTHNKYSDSNDFGFTLSKNLEDAFNVLEAEKFNPSNAQMMERNISRIKKHTRFSDTGHEIDIPEYLSGSEKQWLDSPQTSKRTRIIYDVLIITFDYNSGLDAAKVKEIGYKIIDGIYHRNVIPRRLVLALDLHGVRMNTKGKYGTTFIDVSFKDLHGIAQMLHPSSFRRLWFRIAEIYSGIPSSYGRAQGGPTERGFISIEYIYHSGKGEMEVHIDTFLGIRGGKPSSKTNSTITFNDLPF